MEIREGVAVEEKLVRIAYLRPWEQETMKALLGMLNVTRKSSFGSVFNRPVDYQGLGLVDYLDIIPKPMDITTVIKKLTSGSYEFMFEVLTDVHLIFENSRVFNGEANKFYEYADATENTFIAQLSEYLGGLTGTEFVTIANTKFPNDPPVSISGVPCTREEVVEFIDLMATSPLYVQAEVRILSALLLGKQVETVSVDDLLRRPTILRKVHSYTVRKLLSLESIK